MVKDIMTAKHFIRVRGDLLDLSKTKVMGILNITPDSFYEGSRMNKDVVWQNRAAEMVRQGVDILDVGGYSSRPGAEHISQEIEMDRIVPVVEWLRKELDVYISIDTFRAEVAAEAIRAGADIVNDISAGQLDKNMWDVVTTNGVPYIMMHMKGTPQTMRELTDYDNLLLEMVDYFQNKIFLLNQKGLADIIIDTGFGFAKTINQNYEILRNLDYFKVLERPILAGVSRKSMIFKTLGTDAAGSLNGTTVLNTIAIMNGAGILRVHDVPEALEAIKLVEKTLEV